MSPRIIDVSSALGATLTADQRATFERDGFLHVKHFITREQVTEITGAMREIEERWVRDGVKVLNGTPIKFGTDVDGRPIVQRFAFASQHHPVLAELLAHAGAEVSLVTPAPYVSDWARNTLEQGAIHRRLAAAGVGIVLNRGVARLTANGVETNCTYTDARDTIPCDAVLLVTAQQANDALYRSLSARQGDWAQAGILSVQVIGDANAPGPIAWATFAGHRYARDLDTAPLGDALPFRREVTALAR